MWRVPVSVRGNVLGASQGNQAMEAPGGLQFSALVT